MENRSYGIMEECENCHKCSMCPNRRSTVSNSTGGELRVSTSKDYKDKNSIGYGYSTSRSFSVSDGN